MWKLKWYVNASSKSDAEEEYLNGTASLRAAFDVAAAYLKKQEKQDWKRPQASKLVKGGKGDFRDYYEIRFKSDNVQQRPIGYFGPGEEDFTILIWAIEKGGHLQPRKWREKADRRRKEIEDAISSTKCYARKPRETGSVERSGVSERVQSREPSSGNGVSDTSDENPTRMDPERTRK